MSHPVADINAHETKVSGTWTEISGYDYLKFVSENRPT
jgi:hypothetical protein